MFKKPKYDIPEEVSSMPWTREQSIAFECAREAITDLMAIYVELLANEEAKPAPDRKQVAKLQREIKDLGSERQSLAVEQHDRIAQIRAEYGRRVQEARAHPVPWIA